MRPIPVSTLVVAMICVAAARLAGAQTAADVAPGQPEAVASRPRTFDVRLAVGTVYDSNVNHDLLNREAYGAVASAALLFRSAPSDPSVELTYEAALHAYRGPSPWDRVSHHARLLWQVELGRAVTFATVADVSLKGNSEDRDLSDQYLVGPRLEVDLASGQRLRLYGAYRLKQYEDEPRRDARNPMAGVEYRLRTGRGDRWEAGVRYDVNLALGERYRYERWTLQGGYAARLSRADAIDVQLTLRFQRYPFRLVDVDGVGYPRRDSRWIPEVGWTRQLGYGAEARVAYRFESRESLDPRKRYDAHLVQFGVVRQW